MRDWNAIGNDPKIDLIVVQSGGNSLDDGGTDYQTQLNTFFTNLRDNMNGDTEVISIAPYWDGAKHDIHRGIHATLCDTYGFPNLDLRAAMGGAEGPWENPGDSSHLNADAHERWASWLADLFVQQIL